MRCSFCDRHLRLRVPGRPLRLLLPRCRACGYYTLPLAHKIILVLLTGIIFYLLLMTFLPPFTTK